MKKFCSIDFLIFYFALPEAIFCWAIVVESIICWGASNIEFEGISWFFSRDGIERKCMNGFCSNIRFCIRSCCCCALTAPSAFVAPFAAY